MTKLNQQNLKKQNLKVEKAQKQILPSETAEVDPPTDETQENIDLENPLNLPYFEESVLNSYKARQYTKCIKTIERILKVTPKEQASHYKILLAAANTMLGKNFKRSHNLLNEVLTYNPYDAYALYGKGVAYYFQKNYDESLKYFDLAIEVDGNGMQNAKDMKIRAQIERKRVVVVLKKFEVEIKESPEKEAENDAKCLNQMKENRKNERIESNAEERSINLDKKNGNCVKNSVENQENVKNVENIEDEESFMENIKRNSTELNLDEKEKNLDKKKESTDSKNEKMTPKSKKKSKKFSRLSKSLNITSNISFSDSDRDTSRSRRSSRKLQIDTHAQNASEINTKSFSYPENFIEILPVATVNLDSSLDEESADLKPTSSANSFAQKSFNKGLDLYMIGQLQRSIKYFQKSLKLEPDFEEADEMGTKAQEFIDLLDVVDINLKEKNFEAVVEICYEALDIDEANDVINRKFYFQRGLAYFQMDDKINAKRDYEEYERLGRKLEES